MKKILNTTLILFCIALLSPSIVKSQVEVYAEGDQLFGINYSVGFPLGEFSELIEKTSWRGFNFEYDVFVASNLSVGFHAGYALFHEIDERDTYTYERDNTGIAISAKLWKYTHIVPLHATARYYFTPSETSMVHLFGGVGVGTSYVNQEVWVGVSTIRNDYWRFSLAPEAGLDISTGGFTSIIVSGQYHYILDGHQDKDALTNLNLRVGFKKWIQ